MVARFLQSAELAKKLNHPNILPVLDAGEDDDTKFLITRHEKGFFLNEYLEHRGQLDELESARLIEALCEALKYAWDELKLIHRNICPDTIFVAKGNVPKLTDFDLAKSLDSDNKLTMDGFTVGDPLYMSPEQARGESVDFSSDMYCMGLVFYQLLAGKPLFHGRPKMEILRAQVSEVHTPIKTVNPEVSDACSQVLDKMLAKQTQDRYPSWAAVIEALNTIAHPVASKTIKSDGDMSTSQYKMQAITMAAVPKPEPKPAEEHTQNAKLEKKQSNKLIPAIILIAIIAVAGIVSLIILRKKSNQQPTPTTIELFDNSTITAKTAEKLAMINHKSEIVKSSIKNLAKAPIIANQSQKPATPTKTVDKVKEERNRKTSLRNIKQIGVALLMYANVFESKFPEKNGAEGLDELRKNGFVELPQIFVSPATEHIPADPGTPITEKTCDYVYVGGLSSEYSNPKTPILWTKPGNHHNFGIVLYVNGEVESFTGSNWLIHTKSPKK
jgi:serine/threonine protein kinase